jgi:hypothetical protein
MATKQFGVGYPAAGPLTGTESLSVVQGGVTVDTTAQAVANLGSGGGSSSTSVRTATASDTAVIGDANNVVQMNVASANTFTVPPNSSVAFPVGSSLEVWQQGAGQTTITAGAGVTILYHSALTLKMKGQNSGASLRKVATNTWRLVGDMEAAP